MSVLIDEKAKVLAQGSYEWENEFVDGLWTYSLGDVEKGLQASYADLVKNYGQPLKTVDSIGISGMMHGYLAFDKNDRLLVPFRTWRNTNTEEAANELSIALEFNIPQRWSATHYYQAVLNSESHVKEVAYLTTLAGYVHWRLTGKKVLGIGDASGMFPILNGIMPRKSKISLKRSTRVQDVMGIGTVMMTLMQWIGTLFSPKFVDCLMKSLP
jgi:sugar (pentulose or hexulose) kinase